MCNTIQCASEMACLSEARADCDNRSYGETVTSDSGTCWPPWMDFEIAAAQLPCAQYEPDHTPDHDQTLGSARQTLVADAVAGSSRMAPCALCGSIAQSEGAAKQVAPIYGLQFELANGSPRKHAFKHTKPCGCPESGCAFSPGFATKSDMERHRKSVHKRVPQLGNKTLYRCLVPSCSSGQRLWPRADNFRCHVRRRHKGRDELQLLQLGAIEVAPVSQSPVVLWPAEYQWNHPVRDSVRL